ncbi:MAG: hypothetical protein OXU69_09095 [Gemmatimonadota bacterium]|nr:hypothetical protein [Gemmatimonadota bacterium]
MMCQRPDDTAVMVMRARGLFTLAVASIAAGGCGDPPAEIVPEQRYDSAGITVVVSHTPPARLVLSDEPRTRIGVVSGDTAYLFYDVSGARLLDNGQIVVSNCLPPILRWYDTSGVYLTGAGREGEGPDEFSAGACARLFEIFALSGGRVETWDHRVRRVRVFDSSGAMVDTHVLETGALTPGPRLAGRFDRGHLMVEILDRQEPAGVDDRGIVVYSGNASWRETLLMHTFGEDGEYEGAIGRVPGLNLTRIEMQTEIGPMNGTTAIPFAPHGQALAWGSAVAVGEGGSPEVRVLDRTGQLTTIIRWTAPRVPVTDDMKEGWIEERLARGSYDAESSAQHRRTADALPYPDTARAYDQFRVGSDGLLWVQQFVPPGASSATWLAFAPSGSLVASMDLPRGARLLDIGDDYVLLRVRDEFDVESVVLHGVMEQRD